MSLTSVLVFAVPILIGSLAIHLVWPGRKLAALVLKLCLGAGAGLGLSSILHFIFLSIAPGRIEMLVLLIPLMLALLAPVILRERRAGPAHLSFPRLSLVQWGLIAVVLAVLAASALSFIRLTQSRPQGAFDAWSIWNRAARFIYRDPQNWQATLSPDLYWGMHADYPLLIPLNVAWGWETLDSETLRIPMVQAAVFTFGSFGLLFASVALMRSAGQAALASLLFMATSTYIATGAGLISDVPVAFYILAASTLIYIYYHLKNSALLGLAGFMAGLAGWSKNEGLLFVAGSCLALALAGRREMVRTLAVYLAGLALPLAVIVYFKIALAPPGDLFTDTGAAMLEKVLDPSRYHLIWLALIAEVLKFPGWPFSILLQLALYALILRPDLSSQPAQGLLALCTIILFQILGYCAIYLLTPQDLGWHLGTSFQRLVLHIYPAALFLFFCVVSVPEKYFAPAGVASE